MITTNEQNQNRQETIYPWSRADLDRLISYKIYGIDLTTLGPRLYLELQSQIRDDEMNTVRNILVSKDCSTLLIVLLYQNKHPLPKEYSHGYFLKFSLNFKLLYAIQEEVVEVECNHYQYN